MAISEETAGHRATLRVLAILDALAANQKGLTMAEICRELGAPKSSLFPILHTMADTEYIAYDEDTMRYSIGLRTYLLSKAFDRGAMGLPLIEGEMRRVVGTCNETCQAGTLDHGRVLYIARVDSPQRIRLSSEIGKTLPAHCTASLPRRGRRGSRTTARRCSRESNASPCPSTGATGIVSA